MPKKDRILDPVYANLIMQIYKGINSQKEILKCVNISQGELRNKIMYLNKLGLINSSIKRLGRGKGIRARYSLNYHGFIRLIIIEIFGVSKLKDQEVSEKYDSSFVEMMLKKYIDLCMKENSVKSIFVLLESFIFGIGRLLYIRHQHYTTLHHFKLIPKPNINMTKEQAHFYMNFASDCIKYYIKNKIPFEERISSEILHHAIILSY